jgi:hypothetical protein
MRRTIAVILCGLFLSAAPLAYGNTTTLYPSSDGTYTQWTPNTGTTHYTLVNETSCDGNTNYVHTTTTTNRDSYGIGLGSIPNGAKITSIDIVPCASKDANGNNSTMNVFYRLNGSNSADLGNYILSDTTPTVLSTTTYSGLSTIKDSGTTLEIGEVHTSGSKGLRVSAINTAVTYTPLNAPSGLTASSTGPTQISISWADNSTIEDGYVIERQNVTASSSFVAIATTSANVTAYIDSDLSTSTTYAYSIRAYDAGGYSDYSNTATATTTPSIFYDSGSGAYLDGWQQAPGDLTMPVTLSADDNFLVVGVENSNGAGDTVTGVTWNDVPMNFLGKVGSANGQYDYYTYLYGLMDPDTGTHNVKTQGATGYAYVLAAGYKGVDGLPTNVVPLINYGSYGYSISNSITTSAADAWVIGFGNQNSNGQNSWTGMVSRASGEDGWVLHGLGDTNGPVSPGPHTFSWGGAEGWNWNLILMEVDPDQ